MLQEHAESAQIACEVAGAIKTVASLTRELAFYQEYSDSLESPLQRSNRTSWRTSALFGLVQSFLYFSAALVSMACLDKLSVKSIDVDPFATADILVRKSSCQQPRVLDEGVLYMYVVMRLMLVCAH